MGFPCWLLAWTNVLTYVSLPHLFVYTREERALVFVIIIVFHLCTCLGDIRVHGETLEKKCLIRSEMLRVMKKS